MSILSQKQLAADIEHQLSFSFESYNKKREDSEKEIVDWESFIMNVAETVIENNGTIEDGIEIAEDAFRNL